jgi:putative SOS response-associated peptidase YedK
MCNLYSITKGQQAIVQFTRAMRDRAGNLPPLPAVFPDMFAPVVRTGDDGERELVRLRWGMPTPPRYLKGAVDRGVTNIRNVASPHWRRWTGPESRCLVMATSFCEPSDATGPDGRKVWTWFALSEERPLFAFAGIWGRWTGTRGTQKAPEEGEHELFGFLTTEPNGVVRPVHSKAMPVILTTEEEIDVWMSAPMKEALELQRPLPEEILGVVGVGRRDDPSG